MIRTALISAAVLWWYIGSAVTNAAEPFFTGLGHLPGGEFSEANGVSADGSIVVGRGSSTPGWQAFRWTQGDGIVGLGDMPGGVYDSRANDVSADGSVVVGRSMISYLDPRRGKPPGSEALRWTQAGGMVGLGDLPGGLFYSDALDISADGSVVVGQGSSTPGYLYNEAFRWTQVGGIVGLGYLPGGSASRAFAVSADGSVIAGVAYTAAGSEAFRWTEVEGMVGLGDLPGGNLSGWAFGISADGAVIIGRGSSASGLEAFRWTQAGGMDGLGDLPLVTRHSCGMLPAACAACGKC
jgi:probable HAF family extracellular repeat protein